MVTRQSNTKAVGGCRHLTFGEILKSITTASDDYDAMTMRRLEAYKRLDPETYGVATMRPVAKSIACWDFLGRRT